MLLNEWFSIFWRNYILLAIIDMGVYMLTKEDKEFFGEITDKFKELAKLALYEYRPKVNAIINGFKDNENDIGLILDGML